MIRLLIKLGFIEGRLHKLARMKRITMLKRMFSDATHGQELNNAGRLGNDC